MTIRDTIDVLCKLIQFPSVSSESNVDVNHFVSERLESLGFEVSQTQYQDRSGVNKSNLVAVRMPSLESTAGKPTAGKPTGGLAYFCHTDVVPAKKWIGHSTSSDPFTAEVANDRVYGRGSCDMKGSLACAMSAAERVDPKQQTAPLWIVCTADEEVGFDGAKHIVQHCGAYRELVDSQPIALIGEPTELNVVYAHKGIQGYRFRSTGRAGHSATRYGINANEAMVPMLNLLLNLCHRTRDSDQFQDSRFDPPTLSWNFGVSDHSDVVNITPEHSDAWLCFRTMPGVDGAELVAEATEMANELGLTTRELSGCGPMWTDPDADCINEMQRLAGTQKQAVCYGTDAGVLTELNHRMVIGPGSIEQAHTVDEWIAIDQLSKGVDVYEKAIRHWCC